MVPRTSLGCTVHRSSPNRVDMLQTMAEDQSLTADASPGFGKGAFVMLNKKVAATQVGPPFRGDFNPGLVPALVDDLSMQMVPGNRDDLSSSFILDQGGSDRLLALIDFPFLDGDRLFLHAVKSDKPIQEIMDPQITLSPLITEDMVVDHNLVNQLWRNSLRLGQPRISIGSGIFSSST